MTLAAMGLSSPLQQSHAYAVSPFPCLLLSFLPTWTRPSSTRVSKCRISPFSTPFSSSRYVVQKLRFDLYDAGKGRDVWMQADCQLRHVIGLQCPQSHASPTPPLAPTYRGYGGQA